MKSPSSLLSFFEEKSGYSFFSGSNPALFSFYKKQIFMLFNQVFGKEFDDELWIHFYENNPCGPASGVFCFAGDELVGFTALLPQEACYLDDGCIKVSYGLSAGTMIQKQHRRGGRVFSTFCSMIEMEARKRGFEYILGFPNRFSLGPFLVQGGWVLIDEAFWLKGELDNKVSGKIFNEQKNRLFLTPILMEWRLERNSYFFENGFLCKLFEGEKNHLDCVFPDQIKTIEGVFPWWQSFGKNPAPLWSSEKISMCGKAINESVDFSRLKRSILFSDVY